jgi:parallel beta-helix repeat protein
VTISTAGLTLEGSGTGTIIEGGTNDVITVSAQNVSVKSLVVADGGDGVVINSSNCSVSNITSDDTNNTGEVSTTILVEGDNCRVKSCKAVESSWIVKVGASTNTNSAIISNCFGDGCFRGYEFGDNSSDCILSNCISVNASDNGIQVTSSDNIVVSNRVNASGDDGVLILGGLDNILANNRISDSANQNIDNNEGTTVLDDNLTGPAN